MMIGQGLEIEVLNDVSNSEETENQNTLEAIQ